MIGPCVFPSFLTGTNRAGPWGQMTGFGGSSPNIELQQAL
jgi:hypothetical protein